MRTYQSNHWLQLLGPSWSSSARGRVGEWPRGVSPLGSRRTVQEPLSSHSSHCPALGPHAQPPVCKQLRLASGDAHQPSLGLPSVAAQPFVFPLGPSNEILVDALEKRI